MTDTSTSASPDSGSHPPLSRIASCIDGYDPDALPVAAAQALVTGFVQPVRTVERCPLTSALGRVLAEDVVSAIDVPAHDNSAMDGFAVRSADLAAHGDTVLRVAGTALAGRPFAGAAGPGEAVRVMTGAVMPSGTDTVVIQEAVRTDGDRLTVPGGQQPGQNTRARGEDLAVGQVALPAGRVLRPADLGLLASLGIGELAVRRRLRVAFFSTGDELRSIGQPMPPGCVYDSNRYTIRAMLQRMGVDAIDLGVVPDHPEALEAAMTQAAAGADAVVSSGGVSVGEADYTRALMARLGDVAFWRIAMRPGRPMAFGRVGGAYYFGLPGNPVAVMVTFYFIVRAALLALSGAGTGGPPLVRVRSASAFRKKPGRTEYQRAVLRAGVDGVLEARITGQQGSGVLSSMSLADCIVVLHHEQGSVAPGDPVDALLFEGLI